MCEWKCVVDDVCMRIVDGVWMWVIDMYVWLCRDIDVEACFIRFRVG